MASADNERPAQGRIRRTIIITPDHPIIFPEENLPSFLHTILITTTASGQEQPSKPCTIHHWDHPITALSGSVIIPTGLSIDSLSYVEGFRELGWFRLPHSQYSPQEIHNYLSSFIRETAVALCPTSDNSEIHHLGIHQLVRRLQTQSEKSTTQDDTSDAPLDTEREVMLFCAQVIGSTADVLFADDDSIWRWEKPTSVYHRGIRREGWASTIDEAVEGAVWEAGRNSSLRVEGVDRRQKNFMFREDGRSLIIPPKSFRE